MNPNIPKLNQLLDDMLYTLAIDYEKHCRTHHERTIMHRYINRVREIIQITPHNEYLRSELMDCEYDYVQRLKKPIFSASWLEYKHKFHTLIDDIIRFHVLENSNNVQTTNIKKSNTNIYQKIH